MKNDLNKIISPGTFFSRIFYSKITRFLVPILAKAKFTPNQVTVISLMLGLFSGYIFTKGTHLFLIIGAIILQISYIFDYADGQLARYLGKSSFFGAWFDSITDRIVEFAVIFGLCAGHYSQVHKIYIWKLGFGTFGTVFLYNYVMDTFIPERLKKKTGNAEYTLSFSERFKFATGRDIVLLVITLGALFNVIPVAFWVLIAGVTSYWIFRVCEFWRKSKQ